MLLLPERKALFLHIPKTGGQTIERLLGFPHRHQHHSSKGLPSDWQRWFRFTFVRHPVDRFISACNYYVDMAGRHQRRYRQPAERGVIASFRLWLLEDKPSLPQVVEALQAQDLYRRHAGFAPQLRRIRAVQPQFLGRFERFADDVNTVLTLLDVDARLEAGAPRINASKRHYRQVDLDGPALQALSRMYRADFQQLGYRPAPPTALPNDEH